ncbi:YbaK/EbsC family protein [Arthrobacter sp. UYCu712]|uniref:aminoacyl-tRNA deacylase n=1 Tax=Arthrobacter sp. UYCu712 TaxID=3156340 RepID=UPI003396999A
MTDSGTGGGGAAGAGRERFLADAAARGLEVRVVERLAANSLEDAARILGIQPADIVKSLVVRHKDGSFLFALIPGDRQISWPKFRALVGVNKLSLPTAEVALEATGYARGTITPLGSTVAWPVYADCTIAGRRISMGAGEHGFSAFVDADALTAALDAVVADISEPN